MGMSGREREIVEALVETKAVDFEAIGNALARFGPTAALDFEFEDGFCGTMRNFVRVVRLPPVLGQPTNVEQLRGAMGGELKG